MKNNIIPIVAIALLVAVVAGIIARYRFSESVEKVSESGGAEPAILVTESEVVESTDVYAKDMKMVYKNAKNITVELVERTTIESDTESETVYDRYLVSDVDLAGGSDNTCDYHEDLADSDNMDVTGEKISFSEAFGFSYSGMNAYETYERLLKENGLSLEFDNAVLDEERSALTGEDTYSIEDTDVIDTMLSGETYDEITDKTVYVQVSEDGLPEYFSAEVTYSYGEWIITKSLYLQVSTEDGEEEADEN